MLYYLPLESYRERYTMQWSAANVGWMEKNWKKAGIQYERIDTVSNLLVQAKQTPEKHVKTGVVLDPVRRATYCFSQVSHLLRLAEEGKIKDSDVIYWDDFWHPGIEAIPYTFSQMGIRPRYYAFLHAQSVDKFDFTWPMRHWMRHYERGQAEWMDGIFVDCPTLKDLVVLGGIIAPEQVHVVGLPFDTEEVMSRMPEIYQMFIRGKDINGKEYKNSAGQEFSYQRKNQVVFSSRWDKEKCPEFFLAVADKVITDYPSLDSKFVVCTSAPKLRSNDGRLILALKRAMAAFPGRIELREDLTKEAYYATLCESKVQFNCSDQDFVSYTLLEASAAGCYPLYPYFRSFPETLLHQHEFMYEKNDLIDASAMIANLLAGDGTIGGQHEYMDLWSKEQIKQRSWIHERFDGTWLRMASKMGLLRNSANYLTTGRNGEPLIKNPFQASDWGF